jgi:hypothetical protein
MGMYFILYSIDEAFPEEGNWHALHSEIQALKGDDKVLHHARLFQLGQTT